MFVPLKVSSKFPICNLPLRLDTYSKCSFNCEYCFSNNRQRGYSTEEEVNFEWLRNKFIKVYDDHDVNKESFIEVLLNDRITLHGGGLADCFQSSEQKKQNTKKIVDLCNEYNQTILFSTKTDTVYDVDVNPSLHTFQLSITNTKDHPIEANVHSFKSRYEFYKELIDKGFKVGIRIQPFIPRITDIQEIVECFDEASHFTIESIKLVPSNPNNKKLLKRLGLKQRDFTQMGLLNLKPSIRVDLYEPIIKLFEDKDLSYSIADNDLHHIGNNCCCCGDQLITKGITFSNTNLIKEYGLDYTLEEVMEHAKDYLDCKCSSLYNSDRRNNCITVRDFYNDRFERASAIFSPKFQYRIDKCQTKLI